MAAAEPGLGRGHARPPPAALPHRHARGAHEADPAGPDHGRPAGLRLRRGPQPRRLEDPQPPDDPRRRPVRERGRQGHRPQRGGLLRRGPPAVAHDAADGPDRRDQRPARLPPGDRVRRQTDLRHLPQPRGHRDRHRRDHRPRRAATASASTASSSTASRASTSASAPATTTSRSSTRRATTELKVYGGAGDDTFTVNGIGGAATIVGGAGNDTVNVRSFADGIDNDGDGFIDENDELDALTGILSKLTIDGTNDIREQVDPILASEAFLQPFLTTNAGRHRRRRRDLQRPGLLDPEFVPILDNSTGTLRVYTVVITANGEVAEQLMQERGRQEWAIQKRNGSNQLAVVRHRRRRDHRRRARPASRC